MNCVKVENAGLDEYQDASDQESFSHTFSFDCCRQVVGGFYNRQFENKTRASIMPTP